MNKIYAMLPCYNESENIAALIEKWLGQAEVLRGMGYELTVVGIDDRSTDNTYDIISSYAEKYDNVKVIRHKKNLNLGGGVNTAFTAFQKECSEGDLCVLMDGDNTHDPVYIKSMVEKIKAGADVVIASRYCQSSSVKGVPGIRLFLSDGARVFYTAVLHVKNVKDYTCGYRVYTYEIIKKARGVYGDKFVEMKTFSCMMEVLYKLSLVGAKFDEVPFELRYDNKLGESKMRVLRTVKDSITTAFRLRFSAKKKR